jgi:hypothetical protein
MGCMPALTAHHGLVVVVYGERCMPQPARVEALLPGPEVLSVGQSGLHLLVPEAPCWAVRTIPIPTTLLLLNCG